jgi:hypothetical protein
MVSSVIGHAPNRVAAYVYGDKGTLAYIQPSEGDAHLLVGKKGGSGLAPLSIDPAKQGGWRVEEEFVNAIRGNEPVTHTDFVTGTKYMEWTDAVAESLRTRCEVKLPLLSV